MKEYGLNYDDDDDDLRKSHQKYVTAYHQI